MGESGGGGVGGRGDLGRRWGAKGVGGGGWIYGEKGVKGGLPGGQGCTL